MNALANQRHSDDSSRKCFVQCMRSLMEFCSLMILSSETTKCRCTNDVSRIFMNEWMKHLYSALLCIVVHPKHFTIIWGGLSSTTTSVQHPLGWCDSSHSTTAPVRSPHTSYGWRGERDRANQVDGDYWEAMIDKGQWREFGQDTGVTPLHFTMSVMGFLMTTESHDLSLTSHPKDGFHSVNSFSDYNEFLSVLKMFFDNVNDYIAFCTTKEL